MAYPDDLLVEGEQVVVHTRPHWKTLVGPVLAFLVTVGLGTYAAGLISDLSWAGWGWLGLAALGTALVGWLTVAPVLRWHSTHFVVTNRRVLVREGVLSRQGIDLPMSRINSVRYSTTMVGRMLGCGTLAIETASDEPLEFEDVPDVARVHSLLYQDSDDGPARNL